MHVLIEVWSSKRFHGQVFIELNGEEEINRWYSLNSKENEEGETASGQILVKVNFFNKKSNVKRKFVIEEHKDIDVKF